MNRQRLDRVKAWLKGQWDPYAAGPDTATLGILEDLWTIVEAVEPDDGLEHLLYEHFEDLKRTYAILNATSAADTTLKILADKIRAHDAWHERFEGDTPVEPPKPRYVANFVIDRSTTDVATTAEIHHPRLCSLVTLNCWSDRSWTLDIRPRPGSDGCYAAAIIATGDGYPDYSEIITRATTLTWDGDTITGETQ